MNWAYTDFHSSFTDTNFFNLKHPFCWFFRVLIKDFYVVIMRVFITFLELRKIPPWASNWSNH